MIEPNVARVVHFFPSSVDTEFDRHEAPFAAIVAKVWNDGLVNLLVVNKQGSQCGRQHVPLVQDGQLPPSPDAAFCEWMPYQIGQAARSDELVAALTARLNDQTSSIVALEARIDALEGKNDFDFAHRALERRVEVLEADAANRAAAVRDVFMGGQVTAGVAVAAQGLETALTPTPVGAGVATSDLSALTAGDPKA